MTKGRLSLLLFLIFSCQQNQEFRNLNLLKEQPVNPLLMEYSENNKPVYRFSYDQGRLKTHTQIEEGGNIIFNYEYDSLGKPQKIEVTQPINNYTIYPEFSDSLLSELRIEVNGQLKTRYIFESDSTGKMIKALRLSPSNQIITSAEFTWNGLNVSGYELKFFNVNPPISFRYEYEYDRFMNPYKEVFRNFKFNLIDFIPVSENNFLTMTVYNLDNPGSQLLIRYQYSYSAGLPFFRYEASTDSNGTTSYLYSDYNYVNR